MKVFLKIWTETIAKKVNIETDPRPVILDGVVALEQALQSGQVDSATLTTLEYLAMSTNMQKGSVLLPVINGRTTEEYVLLVHRDSIIREIGDLRGAASSGLSISRLFDAYLARHFAGAGGAGTGRPVFRQDDADKENVSSRVARFFSPSRCLLDYAQRISDSRRVESTSWRATSRASHIARTGK